MKRSSCFFTLTRPVFTPSRLAVTAALIGLIGLQAIIAGSVAAADPGDSPPAATPHVDYARDIHPLLQKYCFDCHGTDESLRGGGKPKGNLTLSTVAGEETVLGDRGSWHRVRQALEAREMPPEGAAMPTIVERERLTDWLEQVLARPDADGRRRAGHVTLRRLNQVEYNNTMFDLFGLNKPPTYFNPRDGKLPDSIRLVFQNLQRPKLVTLPPDDVGYGYDNIGDVLSLPPFLMERYFAAAREVVRIASEQPNRVLRGRIAQGADRSAARRILESFLPRAFRRPVTEEEIDRHVALFDLAVEKGEPFDKAIQVPTAAALVSPHFLFRVEDGSRPVDETGAVPLTDYELATRLSYFLWSTMPDEELLRAAAAGKLHEPDELEAQARRMLVSPKAKALSENFAVQWLQLSNIETVTPDPKRYPTFYNLKYLPQALRQEALLLFEAVMVEDRSVLDLVDPDFTYANLVLARFYGLEPHPEQTTSLFWERYELPDKRRGGVLSLGGVLTATSSGTRTSPVKRGKWILETILGAPPPPPLANVADLDDTPAAEDGLSLREKLERHRADPDCSACHRRMDPLGFGLENYDAVGQWRDQDGSVKIDARGTLADGGSFDGPVELKRLIVEKRRDDFVRCLAGHLMIYALGRKLEYFDDGVLREIEASLEKNDYRFSTLVVGVVRSHPFRYLEPIKPNEANHE